MGGIGGMGGITGCIIGGPTGMTFPLRKFTAMLLISRRSCGGMKQEDGKKTDLVAEDPFALMCLLPPLPCQTYSGIVSRNRVSELFVFTGSLKSSLGQPTKK